MVTAPCHLNFIIIKKKVLFWKEIRAGHYTDKLVVCSRLAQLTQERDSTPYLATRSQSHLHNHINFKTFKIVFKYSHSLCQKADTVPALYYCAMCKICLTRKSLSRRGKDYTRLKKTKKENRQKGGRKGWTGLTILQHHVVCTRATPAEENTDNSW